MPKYPVPPKKPIPRDIPPIPVQPVDTAEDIKLKLIAARLREDLINLLKNNVKLDGGEIK